MTGQWHDGASMVKKIQVQIGVGMRMQQGITGISAEPGRSAINLGIRCSVTVSPAEEHWNCVNSLAVDVWGVSHYSRPRQKLSFQGEGACSPCGKTWAEWSPRCTHLLFLSEAVLGESLCLRLILVADWKHLMVNVDTSSSMWLKGADWPRERFGGVWEPK